MSAATLLPPPQPLEKTLPQRHRHDIWSRVLNGMRVKTRDLVSVANPSRRDRCRYDLMAFMQEYFPHRIRDPQPAHRDMVADYQQAILSKQSVVPLLHAEADPRGFGKTTTCELANIWAAFYGHRSFLLYLGARAENAEARLKAIAAEILNNRGLADDFPELVGWLVDTHHGDPRRAPPDFPWSASLLRLPTGVVIAGRGMDSSLTGLNYFGRRPDFVVMDDVETMDIASSANEMKRCEDRINLEVLHLHERGKPAAYFFINTIRRPNCIAQRLTDPKVSPQWRGRRRAALLKEPNDKEKWDRFIELCGPNPAAPGTDRLADEAVTAAAIGISVADFSELQEPQRNALRYYAAHKIEMDAGAELLDPIRMPLWSLYLERAKDETAFQCELQNNPPEDQNQRTTALEVEHILARKIGTPRGVVPLWCEFLVMSIDVGSSVLHWECDAFGANGLNQLVDQGQQETNLNTGGEYKMTDDPIRRGDMVKTAVQSALVALHARAAVGWANARGEPIYPALIGVDCGGTAETFAWYETVLAFCASTPRFVPLKGQSPWSTPTADAAMGRNWICRVENNPGRRVDCNVDQYKMAAARAYEAPMRTPAGELAPGARILHEDAPHAYAKQQTSERYIETINPKLVVSKELKVGWNHLPNIPNHWWDTCWMAFALADMRRIMQAIEIQRAGNAARKSAPPSSPLPGWVQRERF